MKKTIFTLGLTILLGTAGLDAVAATEGSAAITAYTIHKGEGTINGKVADDQQKPVEAATISLLNAKDSSLVRTAVTGKDGRFSFEHLKEGRYLVSVTAVGHSKALSKAVQINAVNESPVELEPLVLESAATGLQAVSVVAKKPFIEQKADKMVVNVDASPSNAGSTAMDVLERSPGITIDKDDNISLKGKQGVTVMIDGKPTYLTSAQLASYLKGLPASALDQIEIMTNPSAKYDASGNSGIINIRTKKTKMKGFNGSVTLSHAQGVYGKPSGNLNLNYRDGKFNFFFNGGYARWEGYHGLDIGRTYLDAGTDHVVNSIFSQTTFMHNVNPELNGKIGMDYYVSNKTTLGIVLSGFRNEENTYSTSNITLMDPNHVVDSFVYSPSTNKNTWKNTSVNLNFKHQFDSAGRELTADLDLVRYSSTNNQYFDNITYYPDMTKRGETVLTGDLPSDIHIYTLKSDYTRPLSKGAKLEAGIKSSYVNTDNTANYFNVENGVSEVDTTKTNHFLYRENINAAYLNLQRTYQKWTVQAGLRFENTNYSGHQLGNSQTVNKNDSSFSRSYGSLFPTVFVSYQASDNHQFTLNYGRRIDRPAYQDLNPFLFFLDQYTYQAGNPYLQPQFTHNVELSHTYKSWLTTTLNYSNTKNFFQETFEQSGHATIVRNGNIGRRQNAGIAVSAQIPVTKWWTAIVYANLIYTKFNGVLYGEYLDVSLTTLQSNLNNQFTFGKGWSGELSGFYMTKSIEGQVLVNPLGQANAALSKKILKDKGTIKVAFRDMFWTMQPRGSINFQQTEATFHNYRDSRQVSATFVYRFGKPLKGSQGRSQHNGAGDEQNRVKAGGGNN